MHQRDTPTQSHQCNDRKKDRIDQHRASWLLYPKRSMYCLVKFMQVAQWFVIISQTVVVSNIIRAHYSDEFWTEPFKFDPYRFLEPSGTAKQIFSFSVGPRLCIGHKFAIMELTVAVAMITQKLQWRLKDGFEWKDDPYSVVLKPISGLPLVFSTREDTWRTSSTRCDCWQHLVVEICCGSTCCRDNN